MAVKHRMPEGSKREEKECHEPQAMLSRACPAGKRFVAAVNTGPT
jgi:hypothetical protein